MIYEIFGGRDTIVNNLMKQFDSDGDLLNANGVAGMDVTGKGTSWQKLTNVSEEYRQKMFDNVKKEIVFSRDGDTIWQCANCGHICVGKKAPEVCPVCNHSQAYFQVKAENY